MPTIQDQIEKLRKKIEGYRALREDLGEAAEQKIVELETQIQTLVETGGGAFNLDGDLARCAYRSLNGPFFRGYDIGFRVVVSPLLPSP